MGFSHNAGGAEKYGVADLSISWGFVATALLKGLGGAVGNGGTA